MAENPEKVVIEIDLASLWLDGEVGTFADYVAARAAAALLKEATEARNEFERRVAAVTEDEIREQVRPLVAEILEQSVSPTDAYGTPKGPAATLRERIVEIARKDLTTKRGDSFRGTQRTAVEDFILVEVRDAFGKELREVVQSAKADVLAAVRDRAGEIIAESVERLSAGRPL